MNEQETHADIIAEMRMFKCRNLETGELELCNAIGNHFADRLEAALKRELSKICPKTGGDFGQLGNAAKLREALAPHASSLSNSNCPMAFVYADWWAARVDEERQGEAMTREEILDRLRKMKQLTFG